MIRRFVLAVAVVAVTFTFAFSDTFVASITKVEGDKVTYKKFDFKAKDKNAEEATATAIKDVPVTKAAGFGGKKKDADKDKKGDPIEGGLKNEMFSKDKLGEKGVFGQITIDDDGANKGKITSIAVFQFGGKGGKKKVDEKK